MRYLLVVPVDKRQLFTVKAKLPDIEIEFLKRLSEEGIQRVALKGVRLVETLL